MCLCGDNSAIVLPRCHSAVRPLVECATRPCHIGCTTARLNRGGACCFYTSARCNGTCPPRPPPRAVHCPSVSFQRRGVLRTIVEIFLVMSRCSLTCDKVACQFGCPAGCPANCPVDCSIHSFRMVKNPFEVRAYMRRPATRLFITEFQTQFVQHAVDHYRALANEWMSSRSIEEYLSQVRNGSRLSLAGQSPVSMPPPFECL